MTGGQTILVADDSENDLMLLRIAFRKAGIINVLQEVRDGEEAITYLKGHSPFADPANFPRPAVLLLDINMPKANGFAVLDWARTEPSLKHLRIIMMSASMRRTDVERALDLRADSFLVKPTDLNELIKMVRSLSDWLQYDQLTPFGAALTK